MNKVLFLPTDYQAPKTSNHYMKFVEGENKFRILSAPVLGWEDWNDKKPVRYRLDQKPAKSIDPKKPVKHFWAMIIWNYTAEEIQVLHVTQASIRKAIEALCSDADWGAPYFYDIKVVKSGENLETEYTVNPLPHKPLPPHIKDLFNERRCNLDALFTNDDPFDKTHTSFSAGIFDSQDATLTSTGRINCMSMEQAYDLEMILGDCDPKYRKWVFDYVKKQYNTESLSDLSADLYPKMREAALKNMEATYAAQNTPEFLQGLAQ